MKRKRNYCKKVTSNSQESSDNGLVGAVLSTGETTVADASAPNLSHSKHGCANNLEGFGTPSKPLIVEENEDENDIHSRLEKENSRRMAKMMNESYQNGPRNTK